MILSISRNLLSPCGWFPHGGIRSAKIKKPFVHFARRVAPCFLALPIARHSGFPSQHMATSGFEIPNYSAAASLHRKIRWGNFKTLCKTSGRFSDCRIFLLTAPSQPAWADKWYVAAFVPEYSGGTVPDFNGIPFSEVSFIWFSITMNLWCQE